MKPYLNQLLSALHSPLHGRNLVREYLQARILGFSQQAGAMLPLAFHGGTALRFLYHIPRYSEDLHFALERPTAQYDPRSFLRAIQRSFEAEGYETSVRFSDRRVVHSALVRFPGLLYELGLSAQRGEVLMVKIEIDTRPPAGAGLATTVVRRHVLLQLQHHDRPSLLAGKLHALLQREYLKGRDLYDLFWYLGDPAWPAPNLTMLNNALQQTGWAGPPLTAQTWREVVRQRVAALDWEQAVGDVSPFLEQESELSLLTVDNLLRVLDTRR